MNAPPGPNPKQAEPSSVATPATDDSELHSYESIRSCDRHKLLEWIQKNLDNNPLDDEDTDTFLKAKINGRVFLGSAGAEDYYTRPSIGLSFGASFLLAELASKIKGRKRSGEHVTPSELSVVANKKMRTEMSVSSTDLLEMFSRLHRLLWNKDAELRDVVFVTKTVSVPWFADDGTYTSTELEQNMLSLDTAIQAHLQENPTEKLADWHSLLPCRSNSLVFREAYRELLGRIIAVEEHFGYTPLAKDGATTARRSWFHRSFIVSGHPGIGKTWFLSLVLTHRLLHGAPTIWQDGPELLLFDETGVSLLSEVADDRRIAIQRNVEVWVLADQTPRGFVEQFSHHQWLVLITSSPKPKNYQKLEKEHSAPVYYMDVWSWPEMILAHGSNDLAELRTLWNLFDRYGPIPRLLLNYFNVRAKLDELATLVGAYDERITDKLCLILRGGSDSLVGHFSSQDSHSIVLLQPRAETYKHIALRFARQIITPTIGMRLGLLASESATYKGKELYDWMLHNSHFASAAGWVFEGRVHGVLRLGGCFKCRVLTPRDRLEALYEGDRFRSTSDTELSLRTALRVALSGLFELELKPDSNEVFTSLENLGQKLRVTKGSTKFNHEFNKIYWTPEQRNLGAIDSLVISIDSHDQPRAIFFQITISKNHKISGKAVLNVWNALPKEIRKVPPAIVFVVPMKTSAHYKVQAVDITGLGATDDPTEWPQFALGLDDETLWGQHTPPDTAPSTPLDTPPDTVMNEDSRNTHLTEGRRRSEPRLLVLSRPPRSEPGQW